MESKAEQRAAAERWLAEPGDVSGFLAMDGLEVAVRTGEQWIECFSELPVRVTAAYETEVHVTWERDGLKSVLPRDFFVDLFYPSYLLETK